MQQEDVDVIDELAVPQVQPVSLPEPSPNSPLGLVALTATAVLAACAGGAGGGSDSSTSTSAAATVVPGRSVKLSTSGYTYLAPVSDAQAARFLQQAQFAATDADIAAVKSLGYAKWLEVQIAQSFGLGWDWLNAQGYGDVNSPNKYYDNTYPGDYMIWNQLMATSDQFRKRAALALSEFFVVSLNGLNFNWRSHAIAHYWDTLCIHALGNYRDLLEAITLNVAMGYYLNTKGNRKADASGRQPDENYAREVMQLFSIGLYELNTDGTAKLDGAGDQINTYTNDDVSNLARVFTGYDLDMRQNTNTTIAQNGGGSRTILSTEFARLKMVLNPSFHSNLQASFLGVTIPANTAGAAALSTALDTLFNHPNTAPFFCKQMIQRLVTSNPSPAYVGRVAAVFTSSKGDLAQVFAAILMDNEARSPDGLTQAEYGKLREPMVRLVQWARTFNVSSSSGGWKIGDLSDPSSKLGQSPLRSPSVFNFFRPGYVPASTTLSAGCVVPEFQIVNEISVGGYLNYMMDTIDLGISNPTNSSDMKAAYTAEIALANSPSAANPSDLVNRIHVLMCAGQLSAATVDMITTTVGGMNSSTSIDKRNRVCATVLMTMAAAEYLIQK